MEQYVSFDSFKRRFIVFNPTCRPFLRNKVWPWRSVRVEFRRKRRTIISSCFDVVARGLPLSGKSSTFPTSVKRFTHFWTNALDFLFDVVSFITASISPSFVTIILRVTASFNFFGISKRCRATNLSARKGSPAFLKVRRFRSLNSDSTAADVAFIAPYPRSFGIISVNKKK